LIIQQKPDRLPKAGRVKPMAHPLADCLRGGLGSPQKIAATVTEAVAG
jgi:hypothetical protein